ncbi:MAG TPA: elongation factor G, partial [Nordella sp.]|nr:elongation factor G [Nordella sp.]
MGPYLSGKTTLLEAILFRLGAIPRQGRVADKTSIGDAAPEARAHGMSIELNAATASFMDESFTFIDCPGSIEFGQEGRAALTGCDAAVVVCEPDDKKVPALQLILKQLDDLNIPRFIFINKIDRTESRLRDVLNYLQPASTAPLLLRQIPIWKDDIVRGFVDLALERAFIYRENAPSEVVDMPSDILDREKEARFAMLEKLADYDDELMEQLLSDIEPPRDRVFNDLSRELAEGLITPVVFGSAEKGNGILRLMKALRHEAPGVAQTAKRLGLSAGNGNGSSVLQILKTFHTTHGGKLSLSRVLKGTIADSATVYGGNGQDARVAGLFTLMGSTPQKIAKAEEGDTVALGKLDAMATGETISTTKGATGQLATLNVAPGVYGLAISVTDRKDEVKLTSAIAKLIEEDPSLSLEQNSSTHEMVLWGQG